MSSCIPTSSLFPSLSLPPPSFSFLPSLPLSLPPSSPFLPPLPSSLPSSSLPFSLPPPSLSPFLSPLFLPPSLPSFLPLLPSPLPLSLPLSSLLLPSPGYLPNSVSAVEAMLATASIGAVWSSTSPDFGVSVSVADWMNVINWLV